ncbi:MAG: hypothetical protein Q4A37_03150 [Candidatus Saccharibacteria bacterium]|nr:hypothetical protein [Candidatus Saccharibacteria bacterium]
MELLVIGVIIAIIILHKQGSGSAIDRSSRHYQQGYFDGVRASEHDLITSDKLRPPEPTDQLYLIGDNAQLSSTLQDTQTEDSEPGDTSITETAEKAGEANAAALTTPEPITATPQPRDRSNDRRITANIALYVASLLVSVGVTLLASVAGGDGPTVAMLLLFTAVYYAVGLILHAKVPLLQPVALAFIGTGLVMVPAAIGSLGSLLAWQSATSALTSSLIGAGMAATAAVYANSAALGYVMILAILSSGWSISALFDASPAWYYITIMIVAIAASAIAKSGIRLPRPIAAPTSTLSPILMPIALILTTLTSVTITQAELALIFIVATLYYAVGAQYAPNQRGRNYEIIAARVLSIISLILIALLVTPDGDYEWLTGGAALIISSISHALWSLYAITEYKKPAQHHRYAAPITSVGMMLGLSPLLTFAYSWATDAWLIGHIALCVSSLLITLVQALIVYLLRQPHYYLAIIISVIMAAFSAGYSLAVVVSPLTVAPLTTIIVLLLAGVISPAVRHGVINRPLSPLAQRYFYGGLGLWWLIALLSTLVLPSSVASFVQAGSLLIYGLGFLYAAWREAFWPALAGAHLSLTAAALCVMLHFGVTHDTAMRISVWIGAGLMLIGTEWLYRYLMPSRQTAAAILIPGQLVAALVALIASLSLSHPDIWLGLMFVSYYAAWRLSQEWTIAAGHVFSLATVSSLLYHAHITGLDNAVATGWAGLGLLGGLYLMAYRRRNSFAAQSTLITAIILPLILAIISLANLASLTTCAAWGGAVAASLLVLYATWRPLVISILVIPAAVTLSYAGLLTAGLAWDVASSIVAFGWFIALIAGSAMLQLLGIARRWIRPLTISAAVWPVIFGSAVSFTTSDTTYVHIGTILYLLAASALIWEGFSSKLWGLLDAAGFCVLIGLSILINHHSYDIPNVAAILQWHLWAIIPLTLGMFHWWRQGYNKAAITRLSIGFGILTIAGLSVAISGTLLAQLLFLLDHAIMVVAGMLAGRRLLSIWGAIGVTMAALWLLSSYIYLIYILIGVAIIIAVVYSIVRGERKR